MMRWAMTGAEVVAVTLAARTAIAHPGHGVAGGSWNPLHYLTEPVHGLVMLLGAVAVVLANAWARRGR